MRKTRSTRRRFVKSWSERTSCRRTKSNACLNCPSRARSRTRSRTRRLSSSTKMELSDSLRLFSLLLLLFRVLFPRVSLQKTDPIIYSVSLFHSLGSLSRRKEDHRRRRANDHSLVRTGSSTSRSTSARNGTARVVPALDEDNLNCEVKNRNNLPRGLSSLLPPLPSCAPVRELYHCPAFFILLVSSNAVFCDISQSISFRALVGLGRKGNHSSVFLT